jgi:hypothetical protein
VVGRDVYAYVGHDPANHTDPTGQIIDTVIDVFSLGYDVGSITYSAVTGDSAGVGITSRRWEQMLRRRLFLA